MEELIGIFPLILAGTSFAITLINLKDRAKAEKKFVEALQAELKKEVEVKKASPQLSIKLTEEGERLGDNDPALVRAIFREALRSVEGHAQAQSVVYKALNDLAEKDRKYINLTLSSNTMKGRARYIGKLFRKALDVVT